MSYDPQEQMPCEVSDSEKDESDVDDGEMEYITTITPSDDWTNFRNNLAEEMFTTWRATFDG